MIAATVFGRRRRRLSRKRGLRFFLRDRGFDLAAPAVIAALAALMTGGIGLGIWRIIPVVPHPNAPCDSRLAPLRQEMNASPFPSLFRRAFYDRA